jgi:hypothetical protein
MPPLDLLHRLRHLDRSSPEFSDQLTSLLHERGYKDCVASLRDDDSAWLVEYMDNVRLRAALTNSPLKPA